MKNHYAKLYENINKSIYDISKNLIENICNDLNKSDKKDFFIKKYLIKDSHKSITKNNKNISDINTNNPKKNVSAYFHFTEDVRPKLQKKFPNDTMTDISKRLGKLWRNLKEKDKLKYEKMAQKDKQRYLQELKKHTEISVNLNQTSKTTSDESDNNSENSRTVSSAIVRSPGNRSKG